MLLKPAKLFIDESGDRNLKNLKGQNYPILVLAGVLITDSEYQKAVARFSALKMKYFQSTDVVLHEYDIRKGRGPFKVLNNAKIKQEFMGEISKIMEDLQFQVIAVIIDKKRLIWNYSRIVDPYLIAFEFLLERACYEKPRSLDLPVIVEARGKREDNELRVAFSKIRESEFSFSTNIRRRSKLTGLHLVFKSKRDKETGLEMADLVARPIGTNYLNKGQHNRAYQIIQTKFCRSDDGTVIGRGLKIFP